MIKSVSSTGKERRLLLTSSVSLTLEGGYENFREFLKALELNLRLIDIEEIAFSVVENKDFPITIKGRIYYR